MTNLPGKAVKTPFHASGTESATVLASTTKTLKTSKTVSHAQPGNSKLKTQIAAVSPEEIIEKVKQIIHIVACNKCLDLIMYHIRREFG